jgi:hypothetical protein
MDTQQRVTEEDLESAAHAESASLVEVSLFPGLLGWMDILLLYKYNLYLSKQEREGYRNS